MNLDLALLNYREASWVLSQGEYLNTAAYVSYLPESWRETNSVFLKGVWGKLMRKTVYEGVGGIQGSWQRDSSGDPRRFLRPGPAHQPWETRQVAACRQLRLEWRELGNSLDLSFLSPSRLL